MIKPLFLSVFISSLALGATSTVVPTVALDSGIVAGKTLGAKADVLGYLGIPYALPPLGENRWREPQPPRRWTGVLEATAVSKACPQPKTSFALLDVGPQDEDCLYLNVYASAKGAWKKRPVMVWIHGGSYNTGATSIYSGEFLAREGAVVVTMNYRLGALGFLVRKDLVTQNGESIVGNYGLQDQLFALRWVQRNIAQFGGDPDNVTIFGQSAGGDAVARMMVAPAASGLFHRAIMQSGYPDNDHATIDDEQKTADTYAERLGCATASDVLSCLRQAPAADLIKAASASEHVKALGFGPFVDGKLTPDTPLALFQQDKQAHVPVMIGSTQDEERLFTGPLKITKISEYQSLLKKWFGDKADQVFATYPALNDSDAATLAGRVGTAAFYTTPVMRTLRILADQGIPAYQYHFERLADYPAGYGMGIFHGVDIFYLFGWIYEHKGFAPEDQALSTSMLKYWTSFAATGSPNSWKHLRNTYWPAFDNEHKAYLQLDAKRTRWGDLCVATQANCGLFESLAE